MRFWKFPLKVQAYNSQTDAWYTKEFEKQKELIQYLDDQFPDEPQFYRLKNTKKWQEAGRAYTESQALTGKTNFEGGRYHTFTKNSPSDVRWRRQEMERIINGVIYDGIFLPGFYYWYLNYCPIVDDVEMKKKFANVWDGDLWYMQYCMRAILKGKHIGGVKGRQKGYSFKHMAILYWCYCWFENTVSTVGGYLEDLVIKSWRYLEGYRSHINSHTTWKRGPVQPKSLMWVETKPDKDNNPKGLNSKLAGVTFKQREDNDVGGPQTFFNYEEPGISPTILGTLEFIKPAVEKGSLVTGTIIACGSVGQLDDAEGIKTIFYNPDDNNFLAVKNVWDEDRLGEECCIFISEAYNMIGFDDLTDEPFMDADGNSNVPLALEWIERQKEKTKKSTKKEELKQLAASQKCTTPKQAFDERKKPEFPADKLKRQQERIKLKDKDNLWEFTPVKGLLEEDKTGKPVLNTKDLPREHGYPIDPTWEDKRGVCTMYEPPIVENPKMFTYFACVDAVEVEETSTSTSIASLDIFRKAQRVRYKDKDGNIQTRIEGDKLVFTYRGRFSSSPDATNEQMWLGIKLYNAFCFPERNKPNFINYMKRNGRSHYLAKESDVPIFKDLNLKNGNTENNSKVGFHKGKTEGKPDTSSVWKLFKDTAKEYLYTEFGRNTITVGEEERVVKIYTGIDRIDDYWLLEEMIRFVEGKGNYDRLISFFGALFITKVYEQNGFIDTVDEVKEEKTPKVIQAPRRPKDTLSGGYIRPSSSRGPSRPKSVL